MNQCLLEDTHTTTLYIGSSWKVWFIYPRFIQNPQGRMRVILNWLVINLHSLVEWKLKTENKVNCRRKMFHLHPSAVACSVLCCKAIQCWGEPTAESEDIVSRQRSVSHDRQKSPSPFKLSLLKIAEKSQNGNPLPKQGSFLSDLCQCPGLLLWCCDEHLVLPSSKLMSGLNRHLLKWNETNSRVQCGHCPCARAIFPRPNTVWMHETACFLTHRAEPVRTHPTHFYATC